MSSRAPHRITSVRDNVDSTSRDESHDLSKTRRKAAMHALQDVGVALVELDARDFDALVSEIALPERLREAVIEARAITAHGGRKRQLQYVGRLMRDIDATPVVQWLDRLAHGHRIDTARQHRLEQWRERLVSEDAALDLLMAEHPRLDRPKLRALVARARDERARGAAPRAYRELFRALKETLQ